MQNKIVLVATKNVWIFVSCHFFLLFTLTSVNLKKAGMASRNIVIKNNTRCFKSALL